MMKWKHVRDSICANAGEVQKDILSAAVSADELFKSANVIY